MDIRSIIPGLRSAETLSSGSVEESATTRKEQAIAAPTAPARDAIELSGSGEPSASGAINTDLLLAKAVLSRTEALDDTRRAEILERIQSGFYSSPEAVAQIAGSMADELKGNGGA